LKPSLSGGGKYRQGIFAPKHPEKYVGDPSNIIFRSNLERRFFKHFDENPDIVAWGSEEIHIPYVSPIDGQWHRYFVDVIIKTRAGKKFVVEIKPWDQCKPPKRPKRMTSRWKKDAVTYAINEAKWSSADNFCQKNGMEFVILTEKNIGGW